MDLNRAQLGLVRKALVAAEKSAARLASKEEQPEQVAAEYRKFGVEVAALIKAVDVELVKLEQVKK